MTKAKFTDVWKPLDSTHTWDSKWDGNYSGSEDLILLVGVDGHGSVLAVEILDDWDGWIPVDPGDGFDSNAEYRLTDGYEHHELTDLLSGPHA